MRVREPWLAIPLLLIGAGGTSAGPPQPPSAARPSFRFDFGAGEPGPGYLRVAPETTFTKELGYGFDLGSRPGGEGRPYSFSVAVPEGNYRVTAKLGDPSRPTATTIKAESRRLMVEDASTEAGRFATRTFLVNVRTPSIRAGESVRLKEREKGVLHWDEKLTLEFNGDHPGVRALEITPVDDATTVFLVGDSTVTDQPVEPWNSWGQMLPRFFGPGVAVANYAESGESLRSSLGARRLDKVLSVMKPGDYLFIQFGHNDMKERGEGVGAFTSYKADLGRYVASARAKGGLPVLVTSMHRKNLRADGKVSNTLGDYPEAVRRVAREENVPLIDLHAMSQSLYEALGPADIGKAFVDGTHHNNYGSYELARCVVEGIRRSGLKLAGQLADDATPFDPGHPDPPAQFKVPASPDRSANKPDGS